MTTSSILAPTRTTQYTADFLQPFEPQLPLLLLVERVNQIYHAHEAQDYDRLHPEIFSLLPEMWQDMLSKLPTWNSLKILDFGCGTGFEANQVILTLGNNIERITCYDLSSEMLSMCKKRLGGNPKIRFTSNVPEIAAHAPYDVLLTNSLLHHLPDVDSTIQSLLPFLTADAFWLAGHEPSARFYQNSQCSALLNEYMGHQRWARLADPVSYFRKLKQVAGIESDPLRITGVIAYKEGLFRKIPSRVAIDRLVDFHVPHSSQEASTGRGFDFRRLEDEWRNDWSLEWTRTYSFMGHVKELALPRRWQQKARRLAECFPNDGANFCCIWKRIPSNAPLARAAQNSSCVVELR